MNTQPEHRDGQSGTSSSGGGLRRIFLIAGLVVVFAVACAGVFWIAERQAQKSAVGFPNFQDRAFTLVDQSGATVTNADFAGDPIALFFGYTYCPDVCPMTLTVLQTALDELAENDISAEPLQIVFVTVDAERDTPEQLAAYLSLFDLTVTGLTGTPEALQQMQRIHGIYASRNEDEDGVVLFDHSAAVYLYDDSGRFAGTIVFEEPEAFVVAKLTRLLGQS